MDIRRVVAGYGDDGIPAILSDAPAPAVVDLPPAVGASLVDLWRSESLPLTAAGRDDPTLAEFALMPGCLFRVIDLAPGEHAPLWHTTATVDFNYVVSGEVTFLHGAEDAPSAVVVRAGESVVVRGIRHAWSNRGPATCRLVCSSVAAVLPAGVEPG